VISKITVVFREAVKLYAKNHPTSILYDMLLHFDIVNVAKFVQLYAGRWLHVPVKNDIWRAHRNKFIRDALDKEDTKEKRHELSRFFDVSFSRIAAIYVEEKRKLTSEFEEVDEIAAEIYKEEFKFFQKEVEELLLR